MNNTNTTLSTIYFPNPHKSFLSAFPGGLHHTRCLPSTLVYLSHILPTIITTQPPTPPPTIAKMLAQKLIAFLALALTVSATPLLPRQIASSGNDGEGNQDVGNKGQNAGNSAANKGMVKGDYTVEQGVQTCGNAQLNCCNKIEKKGDTTNAGLLGALFGSGDIGLQCTPLNIPVVGGE